MTIIGIEFNAKHMNYVIIEPKEDGFNICSKDRLILNETRSTTSLIAFQQAVKTLFNSTRPGIVAIKQKPETGHMAAGSAALKMESIVLANSPCNVEFISAQQIKREEASDNTLHAYHQVALKTAVVALKKRQPGNE